MYNQSDSYWFQKDDKNIYKSVFSFVKYLDNNQSYRSDDNMRNMRLYGNVETFSLKNYNFFRAEPSIGIQNRVTFNLVSSMVDTIVSKITKNKPKPTFLTEGGDWSLQKKAKKLTQFIEGVFQQTDFYSKSAISFKDSCIFGTGALKIFRIGPEIKVERIFIDELITDDAESVYGEPRQLHQKKWIHKDVLKEMFPEYKASIDMAGSTEQSMHLSNTYNPSTNMLLVIESWHLPASKSSKDGKHTICIENQTLYSEEWKHDYFPFVFFKYSLRPIGFWGQGLAERVSGLQLELNKILRTIQVSMHLVSVPKLLVEASSKIVSAHLNNKIGGIIKYAGTPPTSAALGNIPPELFAHAERIIRFAYQQEGISELASRAEKPAGLNSGKALREFNDLETERFMELAQRYEKVFLDASKIFVNLAKEISEEYKGFKVKVKGKSFLENIDWKQVSIDEDQYMMQVFPTSSLSNTPAGRLQDIQELLQAGFISKEDGMKLLNFPDLQQFYNFNNAGLEDIERAIELIIDKGDYQTPEPYQNLELGIIKMQQAYLLYRTQNAPEERLELFRRWIEDASTLLKRVNEPEPVPQQNTLPPEPQTDLEPQIQQQIPESNTDLTEV